MTTFGRMFFGVSKWERTPKIMVLFGKKPLRRWWLNRFTSMWDCIEYSDFSLPRRRP